MRNAAPAANAYGNSIEFTAAQLGVLVDNGIVAEKAGTDLRTIFLALSKSGLTLEEAFTKITSSQNKLKTATELFDRRAASSALILAENVERVQELNTAYENASGSASELAKEIQDNLTGDVKALSSAWEGLVLSIENGQGPISNALRSFAQGLTLVLRQLNLATGGGDEFFQTFDKFSEGVDLKGIGLGIDTYLETRRKAVKEFEDEIRDLDFNSEQGLAIAQEVRDTYRDQKNTITQQKNELSQIQSFLRTSFSLTTEINGQQLTKNTAKAREAELQTSVRNLALNLAETEAKRQRILDIINSTVTETGEEIRRSSRRWKA